MEAVQSVATNKRGSSLRVDLGDLAGHSLTEASLSFSLSTAYT